MNLGQRLRQCVAGWLLDGVHLSNIRFGERSITISPAGVGDVLRWSATKDAVALGDLGMDVASGKPSAFVAGVKRDLAAGRVIASGAGTAVAGTTTVVLATVTREASERFVVYGFVTNNVAAAAWGQGPFLAATDSVAFYMRRTAVANQFEAVAQNFNVATARTVDWVVEAIVP